MTFDGAEHATAPAGVRATIRAEHSTVTGDRVFRVRNAALASAARRTFEHPAMRRASHSTSRFASSPASR